MLRVAQVVRRVRVNKDGRTTPASEGLAAPRRLRAQSPSRLHHQQHPLGRRAGREGPPLATPTTTGPYRRGVGGAVQTPPCCGSAGHRAAASRASPRGSPAGTGCAGTADDSTWRHRDRALRALQRGGPPLGGDDARTALGAVDATGDALRGRCTANGPMVIDDLRALPGSPLVVAEGSTLLAWALSSGIAERSRRVVAADAPVPAGDPGPTGAWPGPTALYLLLGETIEREARSTAPGR